MRLFGRRPAGRSSGPGARVAEYCANEWYNRPRMVRQASGSARDHLPLTSVTLQVLLSLAGGDRHGYAILKEVRRGTEGGVRLGASSLYSVLKRLLAAGLVLETGERPDAALDDERRRYYRLTKLGREVLVAELRRLEALILRGRAHRLLAAGRRS